MNNIESLLVKDKNKLHLYFDEYRYRAILRMPGIEWFRYVTTEQKYDERLNFSLNSYRIGLSSKNIDKFTIKEWLLANYPDMVEPIKQFVFWRQSTKIAPLKLIITYGRVNIYTNDLDTLTQLSSNITRINYVEPNDNYERGVIYQKRPKYKYRIYFKNKKFGLTESSQFIKFIETHQFQLSPSLKRTIYPLDVYSNWLINPLNKQRNKKTNVFTHENHFVDFDKDELLTVLSLSYPELIRKIYRIEKIKEA